MAYEYDPYLSKSSIRGMYILSIAFVAGGIYLVPVSLHAWRTNTMVHIGNTGHSALWPWEGFVSAFLMFVVGIGAWLGARMKARALRERERENPGT